MGGKLIPFASRETTPATETTHTSAAEQAKKWWNRCGPINIGASSIIIAVIKLVIEIIFVCPFMKCEESSEEYHHQVKLFQVYNCSNFDNVLVVDNCIVVSSSFDLKHMGIAWILIDAICCCTSVVFMLLKWLKPGLLSGILCIPFIAITALLVIFDLCVVLVICIEYEDHASSHYFEQFIYYEDPYSERIFKGKLGSHLFHVTGMKMLWIFVRLAGFALFSAVVDARGIQLCIQEWRGESLEGGGQLGIEQG